MPTLGKSRIMELLCLTLISKVQGCRYRMGGGGTFPSIFFFLFFIFFTAMKSYAKDVYIIKFQQE